VINASWGGPGYSPTLCDAIGQAGDAGVTVVVAAGNDGQDNDATPDWPANCPSSNIIAVAATDPGDGLAWYSNRGATTVDVGAPGTDVLSTLPGGQYGQMSGTSMAAPHVSGIAAVLKGMQPGLQPWQVRAAIMDGGAVDPALQGVTVSGRRADLAGALGAVGTGMAPDTTPPEPFAASAPADGFGTTLARPTFRWAPAGDGQSGVAGYRVLLDGRTIASVGPTTTTYTPAADLAEGVHRWWVVARDGAGNERASASRGLVIDHTAPTAPVLTSPGDSAGVRGPSVELRWRPATDAASGVAGYRILVDGTATAAAPAAAAAARVAMTPGRHTWQVVAADGVGNQAASAIRSVVVLKAVVPLRPSALLPLAVSVPTRMVSGTRPRIRVRLTAPARVRFTVHRSGKRAILAVATSRLRAGSHRITLPARFAAKMRAPRAYVITARGAGMSTATRVLVVRRHARH
jgi:subtilase family protein